ncbi:MAG: flavodoxin domain-containing protein [Candidatus Bathyarchaeota archaeon]
MTKVLIAYGTRYGATEDTSKIITDILRQEDFKVQLINAKKDKIKNIDKFDLIIVGSGIKMGRWTKEPEKFLENFKKELSKKKVALFVCCGSAQPLSQGEEKIKEMTDAKRKYLEEKSNQYSLKPIALGFFGGIYDFNKMSWFIRKTMKSLKPKLEEAGFKETKSEQYDTRNLNTIQNWTKDLIKIVKSEPKP